MAPIPHRVQVRQHPGSSQEDVEAEPEWRSGHQHRIGYYNRQGRRPGLTHEGDDTEGNEDFDRRAAEEQRQLQGSIKKGELINFRDATSLQEVGLTSMLSATKELLKEEEGKRRETRTEDEKPEHDDEPKEENQWKREQGENSKHHDAYAAASEQGQRQYNGDKQVNDDKGHERSEYEKLRERYSPQEIALLRSLQHEKDYIYNLKENDGKGPSPIAGMQDLISIDEADQF